jgi:diguanylate cyclase (GGDEF)-like protein
MMPVNVAGVTALLNVLSCIAYEHDLRGVLLAALVCVVGSVIAMRLFVRTRRTTGTRRAIWLFQAGVATGCAIWTTHFVAMLGYEPPLQHAYDPILTLVSLFIAIGFATLGMAIAASTRTSALIETGGAVLGLGIAAMHFTGMQAFRITGHLEWDVTTIAVATLLGAFFGAICMNRMARPVTRFCKYGGALALILAIVTMHFTAMGAITIVPDLSVAVPEKFVSNSVLIIGVLAVMSLILGTGVASHIIDAQSQEEALQRYRHLALHDAVTGLPNRSYLSTKLAETIGLTKDDTSRVAIIGIDLDRFKDINDVHGHATGDVVLSTIASRLSAMLGDGEFVARVGGDEFVAVKQHLFTKGQALKFAAKLEQAIGEPIDHQELTLCVGSSLGVSLYPDHGRKAEELISRADLAMYRAKQSPARKVCLYDSSMDEVGRTRAAMAMELRHALDRKELELYYQPQNDVATGDLVGYEALLRWNHPQRGLVSPTAFIPIAEETGLIVPIGEWVIRTACAEAASWGLPLKIAVNVASAQFSQSDLPKIVHETLLDTGLSPSRLELEITETSIIDDHQKALHVVRQLKGFGVRIAMDDYGTGYSSLSTLQTFPFDKIKIDRSFINAVIDSEQASAIVRSTIILAESLKIPVLAEGVESSEHLSFLKMEGCHEAQGYLFGKPVPASAIRAIVGTRISDEPTQPPLLDAA